MTLGDITADMVYTSSFGLKTTSHVTHGGEVDLIGVSCMWLFKLRPKKWN